MRGPCQFKKTDVTKAIKAVHAADKQIARVEIAKDGTIVVVLREVGTDAEDAAEADEWDREE